MARPKDPARALATGKRYQGAPCKKGHTGLRYTSTGSCVDCQQAAKAAWLAAARTPETLEFDLG